MLDGGCLDADIAILATGNPPPGSPVAVPDSPRYIANPWAPGALAAASDGSPVVVLGTGLTMVDVALAVTHGHPGATVHAVSRHGLLPRTHSGQPAAAAPLWLPALADSRGPVRLADLLWQVRAAMASRPQRWEEVVDALRPQVPGLWQRLPDADKRLFLRHVARYWEVHRHRMPPATARQVTALRCAGRLSVQAGRVTGVTGRGAGLRVSVEHDGQVTEHEAGWLVNATGPGADVTQTSDPLLRDLLAVGLARPDPLRLGIEASPEGAVLDAGGMPSRTLFTLGPPLRGARYETTAIPEIRNKAAILASHLGRRAARPPAPRQRRLTARGPERPYSGRYEHPRRWHGQARRQLRSGCPGPAPGAGRAAAAESVGRGLGTAARLAGLQGAGHDERRLRGHPRAAGRVGDPGRGPGARGGRGRRHQAAGVRGPGKRVR